MTQIVLNNRTVTVTEELVFYTNFGRHPNLFNISRKSSQTETVLREISQLKNLYKEISKNIEYQQKYSEP